MKAIVAGRRLYHWFSLRVPRRIWGTLLLAAGLLGTGTLGYRLIEGPHWSHFDGFYMTAITLTTIGYGETHELSDRGRMFTVVLAYSGIFVLAYFSTELVRAVVTGELRHTMGRQRVADAMGGLSGHTIVCGYGRMGRIVCQELERLGERFVVIDTREVPLDEFPYELGLPLHGDATADDVLRRAGVDRARALIAAVASDAENLFIALSARLLNATLLIVARAEEEGAEVKLQKVGANKIISPILAGGHRAVQAVLRPSVLRFMDMASRPELFDLHMEEYRIRAGSWLVGQSLRRARLLEDLGIVVIGVAPRDGDMQYTPPPDFVLEAETAVLALGKKGHLERLRKLAEPAE